MKSLILSPQEKDILSCVHLRADSSVEDIRKITGYKEYKISYCLKKLTDHKVIIKHPFINIFTLGYTQYTFFFSLTSDFRNKKDDLITALIEAEQISWVGKLGGDFQYGVSICARSVKEVSDFLNGLSTTFGNIFFEKSIAVMVSITHFRMKYLSKRRCAPNFISISDMGVVARIDQTDHKILEGLTHLDYSSHRDLARQIGIAPSTVDFRIKKLKELGVLQGFTYLTRTSMFGMQMFLFLMYVKAINPLLKEKLFGFCDQHEKVNFLIEYMGAWDYEVGIEVEVANDVTVVLEEFYSVFGGDLNTIRVFQVFDYPKVCKYPFRRFELVRPR